ncbi:medium-chain-fatty-acid-CoA ligase [Mycolicibacterium canariasense]|uniref:Medium-chain-fatty-acid-CoA ligase n=1 Tax=Mycolicibacterium canariasense TaxID=228230 RepID=A0A117I8R5_MYCCR|nr:hypothetical protein AWB94_10895 [Mycolicibacterium canariasense]GAS93664.1 medium-chain-fatty-acid-CoA ligase [Mycolicibacterium canariasense]
MSAHAWLTVWFDGLEGADRRAELVTHTHMVDRRAQHRLGQAQAVTGDRGRGPLCQYRPVASKGANRVAGRSVDFLRHKVARWWIPERWAFVDQLPRTSTGKYDKKRLREWHAQGRLTSVDLTDR